MPKFNKFERENKINHAKKLYIKGLDLQLIAEIIDVSVKTLEKWYKLYDFETARKASMISISEIRNEILNTYEVMRNGGKPNMSPDQISKLVAAFEKLSPNHKSLSWMIEAYELLTEDFLNDIANTHNNEEKQKLLDILKLVRQHCDTIIDKISKEILS